MLKGFPGFSFIRGLCQTKKRFKLHVLRHLGWGCKHLAKQLGAIRHNNAATVEKIICRNIIVPIIGIEFTSIAGSAVFSGVQCVQLFGKYILKLEYFLDLHCSE